jgi:hypothetical protein
LNQRSTALEASMLTITSEPGYPTS